MAIASPKRKRGEVLMLKIQIWTSLRITMDSLSTVLRWLGYTALPYIDIRV